MKTLQFEVDLYEYHELEGMVQARVRDMFSESEAETGTETRRALTSAADAFSKVGVRIEPRFAAWDFSLHREWPWLTVPFMIIMQHVTSDMKANDPEIDGIVERFLVAMRTVSALDARLWFDDWYIPFIVDDDERSVHVESEWAREMQRVYMGGNRKAQNAFRAALRTVGIEIIDLLRGRMLDAYQNVGSIEWTIEHCAKNDLLFTRDGRLFDPSIYE